MPLYVVATPIGNLKDITLRALETLQAVDLIACEDTRQTRKLLSHFNIHKPTVSLHEHNEQQRTPALLDQLLEGRSIALVSDAGTPLISDPGGEFVRAAIEQGIPVVPIPGPSTLTAALSAAGIAFNGFFFAGFLPPRQKARMERLKSLAEIDVPLVFYEAPHRLLDMLKDVHETLGDRMACVARELTKIHEEFLRERLSNLVTRLESRRIRGEHVVIVEGAGESDLINARTESDAATYHAEILRLMSDRGFGLRAAVSQVAASRGLSKNRLYREFILSRKTT